MTPKRRCGGCRFCIADERTGVYRRPPMWFCVRRGSFFSRNYRIGEGSRISPDWEGCPDYNPAVPEDGGKEKIKETVADEQDL